MPTDTGLALFGILKQADPALVDPGVTAQLECLLDDVVLGKQDMVGAIDAVCNVAERIIGRLKEGASAEGPSVLGAAAGGGAGTYPPTPAMKRFADSLVRQKGIKPPPGYTTSMSICRKFLSEHAPRKTDGKVVGKSDAEATGTGAANSVTPDQLRYATKIAIGKGVVSPDEATANAAAIATWIDSNRPGRRRTAASKPAKSMTPQSAAPKRKSRKRKADVADISMAAETESVTETPLRIPYGNKDVALKLGARYRPGGWYAPPGIDLAAFGDRGWL